LTDAAAGGRSRFGLWNAENARPGVVFRHLSPRPPYNQVLQRLGGSEQAKL